MNDRNIILSELFELYSKITLTPQFENALKMHEEFNDLLSILEVSYYFENKIRIS